MTGNYDNVSGVEVAEFKEDESEPAEQRHCKLHEMYFETSTGELAVMFEDRDTGRYFSLSIPVKAISDWNEFVNSLPLWDV